MLSCRVPAVHLYQQVEKTRSHTCGRQVIEIWMLKSLRHMGALRVPSSMRPCILKFNQRLHSTQKEDPHKANQEPTIQGLPSTMEARRLEFTKWFTAKMDSLQATIFTASQVLNVATGYSAIDDLKKAIEKKEKDLSELRAELKKSQNSYKLAVEKQAGSQREVNELLQRKNHWSPQDLERFTELYRNDHINEANVMKYQKTADDMEVKVEECQEHISRLISERYREEQIWSDKIRRASTWGTWGLMGFNVLLFLIVQLGLEPWKRKRLMNLFEERVQSAISESQNNTIGKIEELRKEQELLRPIDGHDLEQEREQQFTPRSSYTNRILSGIADWTTIVSDPNEFLISMAVTTAFGMALGTLVTLAFR